MDRIIIKDQEVFSRHGVFQEENVLGQKFLVTTILDTDTRKAGLNDALDDSTSYADVCALIENIMMNHTYKLIEKAAEEIAMGILHTFPLINGVSVEVKKPWAPILRHVDYCSVKISRSWHKAYLGVGSNMGEKAAYLNLAKERLTADAGIRNFKSAAVIETEPYGYLDQDSFLNTVFEVETLYTPYELLDAIHAIEQEADRKREIHWGPRTLDLDILLYDDLILEDPQLILPHVDMQNRTFVLKPLCELNPFGVHPLLRRRYADLLKELEN